MNATTEIPVFNLQKHHSRVEVPTEFDLRDLSRKFHVFPLRVIKIGNRRRLLLAMRNPFDQKALFDVEFRCGLPVIPVQADEVDIQWLIQTHYYGRKLSPTPTAQLDAITISHSVFDQLLMTQETINQADQMAVRFKETKE